MARSRRNRARRNRSQRNRARRTRSTGEGYPPTTSCPKIAFVCPGGGLYDFGLGRIVYPCKSTINDKCERFNHQRDMQCSYCNAMMGGPTDMFKETVFRALDSLERLERSLHEFKLDFHAGRLPWQQRRTLAIREA